MLQTVSRGAQVVHQHDRFHANFPGEVIRVNNPRQIRGVNAVIDHWPGHAKSCCLDFVLPSDVARPGVKIPG